MTDIFDTEPFKAYDKKFMALVEAAAANADVTTIEKLENEAALLKLALVKAEAKRCSYAI